MGYSIPTVALSTIVTRARAFARTQFAGYPMGVKQFLGQTFRAVGVAVWQLQKAVEDVDNDIVPSPQSSLASLAAQAFLLGLPNGAGSYGLLVPTTASGGQAALTGAAGTVYPNNAVALAEDGTTQIALSGSVTLPGSSGLSSATGKFVALTAGSVGNLAVGTVCTWQGAPAGADPTFTLTSALGGAVDTETASGVYGRIVQRLQTPPRGGNSTDIAAWAEAVASLTGVYVYPRRSGTGTVDVVITVGGSGTGRVPSSAVQATVQAAVDSNRAPGAEAINILLAWTAPSGHVARVRILPSALYPFDWGADSPGTAYSVFSYSAGPPGTITLSGLAPASLKAAITAYINGTGPQPRLQVLSTGVVINPPIGTSKTVTWSDSGGRTTITLDSPPQGWVAPTASDTVYPYGPAVASIASGILAYVDGLGPSRASGYGDVYNTWLDTINVGELARVAEDAVDAAGAAFATGVVDGGATVDGLATSIEGLDQTSNNPELLYLSHVAVTQ